MSKSITITLDHPEVKDGSVKYSTEDGYELMLFVGKQEENGKYFFHRMVSARETLVQPVAEYMVKECGPEIMQALLHDAVEKVKEMASDQMLPDIPTNKTSIN